MSFSFFLLIYIYILLREAGRKEDLRELSGGRSTGWVAGITEKAISG